MGACKSKPSAGTHGGFDDVDEGPRQKKQEETQPQRDNSLNSPNSDGSSAGNSNQGLPARPGANRNSRTSHRNYEETSRSDNDGSSSMNDSFANADGDEDEDIELPRLSQSSVPPDQVIRNKFYPSPVRFAATPVGRLLRLGLSKQSSHNSGLNAKSTHTSRSSNFSKGEGADYSVFSIAASVPSISAIPFSKLFHMGQAPPPTPDLQDSDQQMEIPLSPGIPRKSAYSNVVIDKNELSFDTPAGFRDSFYDDRMSVLDDSTRGNRTSIYDNRKSIYDNRTSIYDNRLSIYDSRGSIMDNRTSIYDKSPLSGRASFHKAVLRKSFFRLGETPSLIADGYILEEYDEEDSDSEEKALDEDSVDMVHVDEAPQVDNLFGNDILKSRESNSNSQRSHRSISLRSGRSISHRSGRSISQRSRRSLASTSQRSGRSIKSISKRAGKAAVRSGARLARQVVISNVLAPPPSFVGKTVKINGEGKGEQPGYVSGNSSHTIETMTSGLLEKNGNLEGGESSCFIPGRKSIKGTRPSTFMRTIKSPLARAGSFDSGDVDPFADAWDVPESEHLDSWQPESGKYIRSWKDVGSQPQLRFWMAPGSDHFSSKKTGTVKQETVNRRESNRDIDLNDESAWPGFDETAIQTSFFAPLDPDALIDWTAFTKSFAAGDLTLPFPDVNPSKTFDSFIKGSKEEDKRRSGSGKTSKHKKRRKRVSERSSKSKSRKVKSSRNRKSRPETKLTKSGTKKPLSGTKKHKKHASASPLTSETEISRFSDGAAGTESEGVASDLIVTDGIGELSGLVPVDVTSMGRPSSRSETSKVKDYLEAVAETERGDESDGSKSLILVEIAKATESTPNHSFSVASIKEEMKSLSDSIHQTHPQSPRIRQSSRTTLSPRKPQSPRITQSPQLPRIPLSPTMPLSPKMPQAPRISQAPHVSQAPQIRQSPRMPQVPRVPISPRKPLSTLNVNAAVSGESMVSSSAANAFAPSRNLLNEKAEKETVRHEKYEIKNNDAAKSNTDAANSEEKKTETRPRKSDYQNLDKEEKGSKRRPSDGTPKKKIKKRPSKPRRTSQEETAEAAVKPSNDQKSAPKSTKSSLEKTKKPSSSKKSKTNSNGEKVKRRVKKPSSSRKPDEKVAPPKPTESINLSQEVFDQ